jgi:predicted secreted protein
MSDLPLPPLSLGLAIYFVVWWITLFAVLPLGVRSQEEGGEITQGTEPGAPVAPMMLKKVLITSVVALPLSALLFAFIRFMA